MSYIPKYKKNEKESHTLLRKAFFETNLICNGTFCYWWGEHSF